MHLGIAHVGTQFFDRPGLDLAWCEYQIHEDPQYVGAIDANSTRPVITGAAGSDQNCRSREKKNAREGFPPGAFLR